MICVDSKTTKPIIVGIKGENDAREIQFDIAPWIDVYGAGEVTAVALK